MKNKAEAISTPAADEATSLNYAFVSLALGFACNVCAGLVSTLMSAYLPNAIYDLLGTSEASQVSYFGSYINSTYIIGWALGGMIFGWIGDLFGRVRTLTWSMIITGISTIAVMWVHSWVLLVAFRFLAGTGSGAIMVLSAVLIAEIWGKRVQGRAVAISVLAVGFPIGIISSGLVTYLASDWRGAFLVGFLPLLLSGICFVVLKEPHQWFGEKQKVQDNEPTNSVFKLLDSQHKTNFFVAATIFGAMLIGIWSTFSWLPTWAHDLGGSGIQQGGTLIILLGAGGIIGSIFAGFLANSLGRKGALMLAFGGASTASFILYYTNTDFTSIVYMQTAFLAIFYGISQAIFAAYIPELFPTSIRSTATGICFNAGRMVTGVAVFFVGILVPALGGYGNSLLIFSATYLIGFAAVCFGRETKGKVL